MINLERMYLLHVMSLILKTIVFINKENKISKEL
jgi:hypothetical protein